MSEKLYSCPFCGNTKLSIARTNKKACWVSCDVEDGGCGAEVNSTPTRRGAIKKWNRRTVLTVHAKVVYDDEKGD